MDDTVIQKESQKDACFESRGRLKKSFILSEFFRDMKLDIVKPSYLAKLQAQKEIGQ